MSAAVQMANVIGELLRDRLARERFAPERFGPEGLVGGASQVRVDAATPDGPLFARLRIHDGGTSLFAVVVEEIPPKGEVPNG
jgi:hypothetical protein